MEEVGGNPVEELVDEVSLDEEGLSEEEDGEEGAEEENGAEEFEIGAEEGDEDELEDRVVDLESALDELKAEFDALMAGEEHEEELHPGIHGDEGAEEVGAEEGDEDEFGAELGDDDSEVKEIHHYHHDGDKMPQDEFEAFMEYVHKVALPKHGDNGVNTKSVVDNMKNDMGGTSSNILRGDTSLTGGTKGGLLNPSTDDLTKGLGTIQNRPDSKAGKTAFTKKEPGHGAEKKGASEKADNTTSLVGKRVR